MRRNLLTLLLSLSSLFALAQRETVTFAMPGGFYDDCFYLSLTCDQPDHHIRFTTNGSTPDNNATLYKSPLFLDYHLFSRSDIYTIPIAPENLMYVPDSVPHAIVIRAAVFDEEDNCISKTFTNTYVIRALGYDSHGLPLLSICADSLDLFDYNTGILVPGIHWNPDHPENSGNYFQRGREWEKVANVEFLDPNSHSRLNQICGLRTHGNYSRVYPSKSLKIYAREEYGQKRFGYRFFDDSPIASYKHLVIKAISRNWPMSGTQNHLTSRFALDLQMEAANDRPVVTFINGEYWGIYFLQEKLDERYLEDHFGIDIDQCNIIDDWNGEVEHGNNESFLEMMEWLEQSNLSSQTNYNHVSQLIDIDNFIDYIILESFILNTDWPGNNMRCWQHNDGPWRWIFFDGDQSLVQRDVNIFENLVYVGPTTWTNNVEATLLFRRLLDNEQFKQRFTLRLNELVNQQLSYANTSTYLDPIVQALEPEINNHRQRFGYLPSLDFWHHGNSLIDTFLRNRKEQYLEEFGQFELMKPHDNPTETNDFSFFPNPAHDAIKISMNDGRSRQVIIQVTDLSGRILLQEETYLSVQTTYTLQTPLVPGIYLLKFGTETHLLMKY